MYPMLKTNKKTYKYADKTLIMGILNVTPDSFSDGGNYNEVGRAIEHAKQLVQQGADIIDIGGESTRPGHTPVSEEEEINRVVPIVKAVSEQIDVPISVDTYKANVAELSLQNGASIINDIWGAKKEPAIAKVAAQYSAPIILTHNRETPVYSSLMDDVIKDLSESIQIALDSGVLPENIIIDPGIGFAKTYEENVQVMREMERLRELDYPVLLGTSRKSIIANTLQLPVDQRDVGTVATVCYGMTKGTEIIRVHNVEMHTQAVKMMDKLLGKGLSTSG
ncbi:dihydropteroate synthase [Gracilibacillus halotolerans]|uniref:Dihydropteroate synthase n=1 Tax=Gracilibacillus halotolerans TaxID=74386 RepID=A0A841RSS0_9BACI|nr:dihydropteroate synthase [Gracilibacillus halotolerans]MBB6513984.1 dihydropteroate synthase [Gracilibacillus halotolerans]